MRAAIVEREWFKIARKEWPEEQRRKWGLTYGASESG
jgi:hypothetical protein